MKTVEEFAGEVHRLISDGVLTEAQGVEMVEEFSRTRQLATLPPSMEEIGRQLAQDEGKRRFSAVIRWVHAGGDGVGFSRSERDLLFRRRNRL